MSYPFTIEGYASLIRTLQGKGYEATSFHDANPNERHLILRHDIDMDIGAAEVMAEQEHKLGVSAIYFVLVRSEIYNPNSASGRKGLESIMRNGHDIGLHFDASLYPDASIEDLDKYCSEEKEILEKYLDGYETRAVSFHRPIKRLMGLEGRFAGCRHVYEPAFIEDIGYCSDSQGSWRFGGPLQHEAVKSGRALHLLTHPIWWTKPREMKSPAERVESLAQGKFAELKSHLADHCKPYRGWLNSACAGRPDRLGVRDEADIEHESIGTQDRDRLIHSFGRIDASGRD